MNWIEIKSEIDLNNSIKKSFQDNFGVAIFKHSNRCSISAVAKMRLSSFWNFKQELPIYLLDILTNREISILIEDKFKVMHESPQLLIIKDGKCIYNASHLSISVKDVRAKLKIED